MTKPFNMSNPAFVLALLLVLALQALAVFSATEQFQTESLNSHNEFRRKHGVPDLKLSETVSSVAKEWAIKLAAEDKMYHRPNNKYGENIFWVSGGTPDGTVATKAFYSEIKDYDFDKAQFAPATGHFTQLVWRGSQSLGIGVATSRTGGTFVVANYYPPGNYLGQFKENVPRPIQ